ncbi:MAG: NAD-dependent epimerase/dehydratase family protein [Candidatus Taylorbacteria bacterium]
MKKVKVIVTGGAGFIGSHLSDALLERGFEVHVIDDLSQGKKVNVNSEAIFHNKNITDLAGIDPIFKNAEYVFHLAALPRVQFSIEHPSETNEANVGGTLNVLIASHKHKIKRVIYSASSSAYGDQKTLPLKEKMIANPKSPYGLQKYIGELYMKLWSEVYKLPTVSLRYFNVYGPRQSHEGAYALVVAKFLKLKSEGKPMTITGDGKQTRDFTHVRDVVRANLLSMESTRVGRGEVINVGGGKNRSVLQVAEIIGGAVKFIPARLEPKNTLADTALAKKLLGWTPEIKFEEGIEELKKM